MTTRNWEARKRDKPSPSLPSVPDPNQPSEVVEFTREGQFVSQVSVDPAPGGAFGLALRQLEDGFVFATVDDNTVVLDIWLVK